LDVDLFLNVLAACRGLPERSIHDPLSTPGRPPKTRDVWIITSRISLLWL